MELGPNQKSWVAALRSGKYRQTRCHLRTQVGYCCLGVLCEIQGIPAQSLAGGLFAFNGETALPSETDLNFVALSTEAANQLAVLNDDQELSFNQIADEIEAAPHNYFEVSK